MFHTIHLPDFLSHPEAGTLIRTLARSVRQWGLRQWESACRQAERPGRNVPYY